MSVATDKVIETSARGRPRVKGAAVATRAEVMSHLRSYGDIDDLGEGDFKIEWRLDNGRSQLVFMHVADTVLVMNSPFAKEDDITAAKALGLAKIFGIAKAGDFYAFRHVVLMEDLDESEITNALALVAGLADSAEAEVGGDRF